jgi:hypothetical protein
MDRQPLGLTVLTGCVSDAVRPSSFIKEGLKKD